MLATPAQLLISLFALFILSSATHAAISAYPGASSGTKIGACNCQCLCKKAAPQVSAYVDVGMFMTRCLSECAARGCECRSMCRTFASETPLPFFVKPLARRICKSRCTDMAAAC